MSRRGVLLPAYLCHSMIQPFEEAGLHPQFYPVNADLSADLAEISRRVHDDTAAVMIMHYFGFPQPADLVTAAAQAFPHLTIIDDRTHVLLNPPALLPANGIAISSPRKWGPFPDLGIVEWPEADRSPNLLDRGYDLPFAGRRIVGGLLRALYFAWPTETLRKASLASLRRADEILDRRVRVCRGSPLSRLIWSHWDRARVVQRRRANYAYLLKHWPLKEARPLFPALPDAVCPLGFPIRTAARDDLRRQLIARRIYPPVHWLRPPQVDPDQFPAAAALAAEELTLVIDQRYNLQAMDHILETLCQTHL
jgi:hypothetical protein